MYVYISKNSLKIYPIKCLKVSSVSLNIHTNHDCSYISLRTQTFV